MKKDQYEEHVIGMSIRQANKVKSPYRVRVVRIDGKSIMHTKEYRERRCNIEIENGTITGIVCWG